MTPDSGNIYSGVGEVKFDRFDADGKSTGLRHLGNTPLFELNPTVDVIEKKSAMIGARATYKRVITGTQAEISLKCDEFDPDNLALVLLGKQQAFTQEADAAIADRDLVGGSTDLIADVWYDLGGLDATVTAVKQGATTLDAGAYEVDTEAGYICFLSSYAGANPFTPGEAATWSGSLAAITSKKRVEGLAVSAINGHLQFKSAADQTAGPRLLVDVWNMDMVPDGAIGFITEEFGQFSLKGQALQDLSRPVGEQYFRVIYL